MPQAWSFARVSSQQQADHGGGLQRQQSDEPARQWCRRHGYEYVESFSFTGSAYKGKHLAEGAPLRRWLEDAVAGRLGTSPALLVEELDRFTRQAGHIALGPLLSSIFPSGVLIVNLRDGVTYSQAAFEQDDRLLPDLLDDIRAAHRYSARLSRRLAAYWEQARDQIRSGVPIRADAIAPFWISFDGSRWTLNDLAPVALRIYSRALEVGTSTIARELNADGIPSPSRHKSSERPWTSSGITRHLRNPAAYGAIRVSKRGADLVLLDDYFPPLISREQWDAVQYAIATRKADPASRGRIDRCRWIGQRITTCACGWSVGTTTSTNSKGKRFHYLHCQRGRNEKGVCPAPYVPLRLATAHLLTRLQPQQLQTLLAASEGSASDARQRLDTLSARHQQATADRDNLRRAYLDAARAGQHSAVLFDALEAADQAETRAREELAAARATIAAAVAPAEVSAAVAHLLASFAAGADTPSDRRAVAAGLRRLGLRVTIAQDGRSVGLAVGDTVAQWEPLDPLALDHLEAGITGTQLRRGGWTVEEVRATLPDGQRWEAATAADGSRGDA